MFKSNTKTAFETLPWYIEENNWKVEQTTEVKKTNEEILWFVNVLHKLKYLAFFAFTYFGWETKVPEKAKLLEKMGLIFMPAAYST
jgi:hypothetical protein